MLMNVDKPQNLYRMRNLQFQPSTTCIKMLPLQNQEPVLAHPCRHLGCQKKMAWRTSTEWGTCHKSSTGVFLYKIRAPNPCFLVHFYDFQKHWPLQSGNWHEHTFKQNRYLEERKPSKNTKIHFVEGWRERTLVSPSHMKTLWNVQKQFCRGNSCSTFPDL